MARRHARPTTSARARFEKGEKAGGEGLGGRKKPELAPRAVRNASSRSGSLVGALRLCTVLARTGASALARGF